MRNFNLKTVVACLGIAGLALLSTPVYAVHDDNLFELGPGLGNNGTTTGLENGVTNILGDTNVANGPDWADLFNASGQTIPGALGTYGIAAATFAADDNALKGGSDRTTFAGSNKNNDLIQSPSDPWEWDTGNVPAKDDITNGYVAAKIVGSNLYIFGGIERIDTNGDSHVDIEFNQQEITLDEAIPCNDPGPDSTPCRFTGEKQIGDIIVSMDFVVGGGLGEVTVRRWNGTEFLLIANADLGGEGCLPTDYVCAFNNASTINGGPWQNYDKDVQGTLTEVIRQNGFSEFGLNVTGLLGETLCFGSVNFKTRTSQSFTAELADFSLHGFEECNATVVTDMKNAETDAVLADDHSTPPVTSTVPVFTSIYDVATVTGIASFPPTGDVLFKFYNDSDCGASQSPPGSVTIHEDTVALTGTGATKTATTPDFQITATGGFSIRSFYLGDDTYQANPATGFHSQSGCEALTVNAVDVTVTTNLLAQSVPDQPGTPPVPIPVGTDLTNQFFLMNGPDPGTTATVRDKATVTGTNNVPPTGTVTFRRYANANCTGTIAATQTGIALVPQSGTSVSTATSNDFTISEGLHCWTAEYVPAVSSVYNPASSEIGEPVCTYDPNPDLIP